MMLYTLCQPKLDTQCGGLGLHPCPYFQALTSVDSASDALFGQANQAVSDAFSSIRIVQAYNLQEQVGLHALNLYAVCAQSHAAWVQCGGVARPFDHARGLCEHDVHVQRCFPLCPPPPPVDGRPVPRPGV